MEYVEHTCTRSESRMWRTLGTVDVQIRISFEKHMQVFPSKNWLGFSTIPNLQWLLNIKFESVVIFVKMKFTTFRTWAWWRNRIPPNIVSFAASRRISMGFWRGFPKVLCPTASPSPLSKHSFSRNLNKNAYRRSDGVKRFFSKLIKVRTEVRR